MSFTCHESGSYDLIEQAGVPPWIRLAAEDGTSFFYSIPESAFFKTSPLMMPRKDMFIKYRVPVNGVALCDNPGSGKTIVSLALIHSKPFVSVKNS